MSSEKPQYSSYGISLEGSTTSPLVLTGSEWTCLVLALDLRVASLCQEYLQSMRSPNGPALLKMYCEAEDLLNRMIPPQDSPIYEIVKQRIKHRLLTPRTTGEGKSSPST
jgi:hypothetical protein